LRNIPSVDSILNSEPLRRLLEKLPRRLVVEHVRKCLERLRGRLRRDELEEVPPLGELCRSIVGEIEASVRSRFGLVVNATGVIIHTGLGRAPLCEEAVKAVAQTAGRYLSLELDLESGERGSRQAPFQELLCGLTGAEAALVVNNNAAAVLLALETLAKGKEVIVSRSELVEIGGSFRMPEIMEKSGARLVAVGTTNKTRVEDYRRAITSETALLLKVHQSNFRIVGFTESVEVERLVQLGGEFGIPVMHDIGSGAMVRMERYGFPREPLVQHSVEAGVSVVTFSGDKLLGGPQAGIIVGKRDIVAMLARNPLSRAVRPGKMTLAALEATLKLYWEEKQAVDKLPVFRMMSARIEELERRAKRLIEMVEDELEGWARLSVERARSTVGGGSLPGEEMPTVVVAVEPNSVDVEAVAKSLRMGDPPVIGRIQGDRLLLDMRTVFPEQVEIIAKALREAAGKR